MTRRDDRRERPTLTLLPKGDSGAAAADSAGAKGRGVTRGRYYLAPGYPNGVPVLVATKADGSQLAQLFLFGADESAVALARRHLEELLEAADPPQRGSGG